MILMLGLTLLAQLALLGLHAAHGETDALGEGLATSALAEVLEEATLQVEGDVPSWMVGDFLKQSASKFENGGYHLSHTFDGFGKLLRWRFNGGNNVTFRTQFLHGNFFNVSERTRRICPARLLGVVTPSQSELPALTNNCSDNFNVNVFQYADQVVGLADFEGGVNIDMDTLTTSRHHWTDDWAVKMYDKIAAAHPSSNPSGDVVVNYVMRINPLAITGIGYHEIIVYTLGDSQTRSILKKIKVKRLPYIHSFTVTQNYVVLAAAPLTWDLAKVMVAESILKSVSWRPHDGTDIYVMRLDGQGEVKKYTASAFFAFHHVNGYEERVGSASTIVFDIVANGMDSGGIPAAGLTVANLLDPSLRDGLLATAELRRYTLNLSSVGFVDYTKFSVIDAEGRNSTVFELPTVNPKVHGTKHCIVYLWAPHMSGASDFGTLGLIKKNVCNDSEPVLTWQINGHFPSEPVFVPRPFDNDSNMPLEEDDGVVTSVVYDGVKKANYLLILDAKTMTTTASLYCRGNWSHVMSFGIHGRFFPADGRK